MTKSKEMTRKDRAIRLLLSRPVFTILFRYGEIELLYNGETRVVYTRKLKMRFVFLSLWFGKNRAVLYNPRENWDYGLVVPWNRVSYYMCGKSLNVRQNKITSKWTEMERNWLDNERYIQFYWWVLDRFSKYKIVVSIRISF